jgi:MFS family permease
LKLKCDISWLQTFKLSNATRAATTRLHMMIFGMVLNAVFTALFGLLEFYDAEKHSVSMYLFLAYASRFGAGIGCGLTDTALYALIAATFRGHKQLPALMGTMESVCGLGFVGGPALGGWLYDTTSFSATMILPSVVLAGYVVLPWYYLQEPGTGTGGGGGQGKLGDGGGDGENGENGDGDGGMKDDESEKKADVKMEHLFRTFRFVAVCWSGVLANVQFGYLEATYAEQAANPGSATRVGFLFAIMALVYCLLTSPVGMICTRIGLHNCLALGFVIEAVGYVVLVPPASWGARFAALPGREHVAMVINGLGAAFSYVPIYPALLKVRCVGLCVCLSLLTPLPDPDPDLQKRNYPVLTELLCSTRVMTFKLLFCCIPTEPCRRYSEASGRENVEGVADLVAGVTGSSFQLGNFLGPVAAGLAVSATSTYHAAIVFICVVFCLQAVVEAREWLFGIKW